MWMRLLVPAAMVFTLSAQAQNEPKVPVIGMAPGLYILHQIQPGETLSGIATAYNTKVGDVMRLNGMNKDSRLAAAQIINIPVPADNIKQTPGGLALVHRVAPGESLYRISVNHGKVPVASIQQWNKLPGNAISLGQDIIVGYLPVAGATTGAQAALSQAQVLQQTQAGTAATAPVTTPPPVTTTQPVKPVTTPATTTPVTTPATTPAATQNTAPVATANTQSTANPATTNSGQPTSSMPPANQPPAVTPPLSANPGESYFAGQFGKNVEGRDRKTTPGNAAIFKTAAGWTDRKYYILMDAVPPGQIVEVINGNGRKVYAKVLWNMRDMKENEGYTYRISNAAAAALGISDTKFNLTVTYFE